MRELFAQFLKEKQYMCNLSPKTLRSYQQAFNAYQRVLSDSHLNAGLPTKDSLKDFVIGMRQAGIGPGGCNVYIRSINSFLTWLHENGHTTEHLKAKVLPKPKIVLEVFSDAHIQALVKF